MCLYSATEFIYDSKEHVVSYFVVFTLDCSSLIIHYGCATFIRAWMLGAWGRTIYVGSRLCLFGVLSTRSRWRVIWYIFKLFCFRIFDEAVLFFLFLMILLVSHRLGSETFNIFDDPELIEKKRKANTRSLKEMATLLRYIYILIYS